MSEPGTTAARNEPDRTERSALDVLSPGWVWVAVFAVVALFGGFLTPWDVLVDLVANLGLSEDASSLLWFVAGYTLPLTVGCAIITICALTGSTSKPASTEVPS